MPHQVGWDPQAGLGGEEKRSTFASRFVDTFLAQGTPSPLAPFIGMSGKTFAGIESSCVICGVMYVSCCELIISDQR